MPRTVSRSGGARKCETHEPIKSRTFTSEAEFLVERAHCRDSAFVDVRDEARPRIELVVDRFVGAVEEAWRKLALVDQGPIVQEDCSPPGGDSHGVIHGVTGQPSAAAINGNAVAPSTDSRTMSA